MANEQLREDNIEKAMKAGKKRLLNDGVVNLTMGKVAKDAGVTQRSLNRYFYSKEYFLAIVTKRICEDGFEHLKEYCRERHICDKSGLEQLRVFLESIKEYFPMMAEHMMILIEVEMHLGNSKEAEMVRRQNACNFEEYSNLIAGFIEIGKKDGSIQEKEGKRINKDLIVNTFSGLMIQLATSKNHYTKSESNSLNLLQEYIDEVIASLAA